MKTYYYESYNHNRVSTFKATNDKRAIARAGTLVGLSRMWKIEKLGMKVLYLREERT